MRDNIERIRALDAEPFGVNPDDAASHKAFIDAHAFPFELLVDEGMAVARAYGAVNPAGTGIARTVVIVGKDGRIIFHQPGAPAWALMSNALRAAQDEGGEGGRGGALGGGGKKPFAPPCAPLIPPSPPSTR